MSKYDGLGDHLRKQTFSEVPMTFAEIEKVTGTKLPPKAQHNRAWWSNNPSNNVMTKVWLSAGYQTAQVDIAARKLMFKRIAKETKYGRMSDLVREFEQPQGGSKKLQNRHPALGAMKGTFTIEPGYDLTRPMYTDEEWVEIEKEMSEDWDQIEQGLSGGKK